MNVKKMDDFINLQDDEFDKFYIDDKFFFSEKKETSTDENF